MVLFLALETTYFCLSVKKWYHIVLSWVFADPRNHWDHWKSFYDELDSVVIISSKESPPTFFYFCLTVFPPTPSLPFFIFLCTLSYHFQRVGWQGHGKPCCSFKYISEVFIMTNFKHKTKIKCNELLCASLSFHSYQLMNSFILSIPPHTLYQIMKQITDSILSAKFQYVSLKDNS